ncbi:amino acid ABC transporter permease [Kurthia sibirica]|uniref:Amino acid ABC transporter permease n=1 Tax=Kurthia sibirica TaxID=202750 RepID=A0A2U3AJR8_9BACL|nr:amino acid ABC transporter permease [Kurthia sibirica]PWI24734.1 amino acid ABC transporter permease [Kurthia sibirica]GEK34764.1 amino acid ABC transporter permease [Kurthia sibirica]
MASTFDVNFLGEAFRVAMLGVPVTLGITLITLLLSVPISFYFATLRLKKIPVVSQVIAVYVSFVRGTPILIQIFIIYNSVPILLKMLFETYQIKFDIYAIHPIWYAFIIFTFSTTALLVEVFRSALSTVDKGQLEAANAVGLTNFQAYRRIIIPQMLGAAMPNMTTNIINLIKATSLGYALSLPEITLNVKVAANAGYNYIEAYVVIFFVYLAICSLVEYALKKYERHLLRFKLV